MLRLFSLVVVCVVFTAQVRADELKWTEIKLTHLDPHQCRQLKSGCGALQRAGHFGSHQSGQRPHHRGHRTRFHA